MRKLLLAATTLAALPALALTAADAAPMIGITLQSGATTIQQQGAPNASGGFAISNVTVGAFTVTSANGTLLLNPDYIDLSSVNVSGSAGGTLVITATASGFTTPTGVSSWLTQLTENYTSGSSTVTLKSYIDTTNYSAPNTFNPGCATNCTLLSTVASGGVTPFAGANVATGTTSNPFAVTEVITISSASASRVSLDASVQSIPEPASLAVLGIGLLGLGMLQRRRT